MKKILVLGLLILSVKTYATEVVEAKSAFDVCAQKNAAVCTHINFLSDVKTKVEGDFVVRIETPRGEEVTNFDLHLWMDMGNGRGHVGAPVDFSQVGPNTYRVQNAWFVMKGPWLIRTDFMLGSETYQIETSVNVSE